MRAITLLTSLVGALLTAACAAEQENPSSIPGQGSGPCAIATGLYVYRYVTRGTGTCGFAPGESFEGVWNFSASGEQTNAPSRCEIFDTVVSDDLCTVTFNQTCRPPDGSRLDATTQITWSRDATNAKALYNATVTLPDGSTCSELFNGTAQKQ